MTPQPVLKASYAAPSTPAHDFARSLPALPADAPADQRTAYLGALRAAVQDVQRDVNTFLTQKMDEDKQHEQQQAEAAGGAVDESKEEANYGEEVVE